MKNATFLEVFYRFSFFFRERCFSNVGIRATWMTTQRDARNARRGTSELTLAGYLCDIRTSYFFSSFFVFSRKELLLSWRRFIRQWMATNTYAILLIRLLQPKLTGSFGSYVQKGFVAHLTLILEKCADEYMRSTNLDSSALSSIHNFRLPCGCLRK